jgi:hypothetical protein
MADHLRPNKAGGYLSPLVIVNRLKSEFSYVETDGEEGRRHVLEIIERIKADTSLRFGDHQMEQKLSHTKNRAIFVCFSDDASSDLTLLSTYVIPEMPLVFEYASVTHEHAVRHLLKRCAAAVGYDVVIDRRTIHDPGYGGHERRGFRRERRTVTDRRYGPKGRRKHQRDD